MSPGKLSSAILEHHEFLIEDQTLSEIALLLRDAVPNIFVEVLVSLIKSDIYSLQVSYLMRNNLEVLGDLGIHIPTNVGSKKQICAV